MRRHTVVLFSLSLLCKTVFADGIGTPFDFEDTAILPKGIHTFKVRSFTTDVEAKFDSKGSIQPLGKPFQKNIKMSQLYKGKSAAEAEISKGYMKSLGINPENDNFGTFDGYVSARATATVPVLGYGLTETHSIAIAIPIVYTNTFARTGFTVSPTAEKFFGYMSADNNNNLAKSAEIQTQDPLSGQLSSLGYDPLDGEVRTELGDIRLINKKVVAKNDRFAVLIKQTIAFPTGAPANPNKVVSVAAGDRQWDVGASAVLDWFVNSKFTISTYGDYTTQLSDTTAKRIPIASDTTLGELDSNVERDLGDIAGAGLALRYKASETLSLATSYSAQKKFSDVYHGNKFSANRYDWLTQNTDQYMEAAVFGVNFSTVSLYRKKSFPVPGDLKLSYSTVLNGRNVPADDTASAEVAIYF